MLAFCNYHLHTVLAVGRIAVGTRAVVYNLLGQG